MLLFRVSSLRLSVRGGSSEDLHVTPRRILGRQIYIKPNLPIAQLLTARSVLSDAGQTHPLIQNKDHHLCKLQPLRCYVQLS